MGLFDFPRIHVWGTHRINVATGNNDSMSPGTEGAITSDSEQVRAVTAGRSDAEFAAWMESLGAAGGPTSGWINAQWNYYGDMSFRFADVRVQSIQLGYDRLISEPSEDPLVGAAVYLNDAVMCDTNPEGYDTTQIFAEALEIRAPGALAGTGTFLSRKPTRAATRWLNWFRNINFHGTAFPNSSGGAGGASATFQHGMVVEKGDLGRAPREGDAYDEVFHRFLPLPASPGASAMAEALRREDVQGLVFRYNLYLTYPRITDPGLAEMFRRGEKAENPAIRLLVGTIAPWLVGEPESITMGRFLRPANSFTNSYRIGGPTPPKPYYLSPCVARVDQEAGKISIDVANCLPEIGSDGMKYRMGEVTLGVRKATPPGTNPAGNTSPVTTLGTITNDRETYQLLGGLFDVDYAALPPEPKKLLNDDGYEMVLATSDCGVLLYEPEYMVASDCECSYLDDLPPGKRWDDADVHDSLKKMPTPALRGEVPIYVRRRGEVPTGPVALSVEQWQFTPTGDPNNLGYYNYPVQLRSETFEVQGGGPTSYRLRPLGGPGISYYRFVGPGQWPAVIDPATFANLSFAENMTILRVLPYWDDSKVSDDNLTFDLVYREVFRYYKLIFPAMSRRLDMADPAIWASPTAASYVLRMIDLRLWETYNYMPRTRDLSASRRRLVERFCRKVIAAHKGAAIAPSPATAPAPAP